MAGFLRLEPSPYSIYVIYNAYSLLVISLPICIT